NVRIAVQVKHAHPACGNGVAWWLEHRRAGQATILGEGAVDLGKATESLIQSLAVQRGDVVVLAIDAREGNHVCDLTEIGLSIAENGGPKRPWDLARDVADTIHAGNPHADRHGNDGAWSFVRGPSRDRDRRAAPLIPADSILGRWRAAMSQPNSRGAAAKLAEQVQALLAGPRPPTEKSPDRVLYDRLVTAESPLFAGFDVSRFAARHAKPHAAGFGLPASRFGGHDGATASDDSLVAAANSATVVRLPAAL